MISNRRKADKIVDAKMAQVEEIKALKKPKAWGVMSEPEKKDEGEFSVKSNRVYVCQNNATAHRKSLPA